MKSLYQRNKPLTIILMLAIFIIFLDFQDDTKKEGAIAGAGTIVGAIFIGAAFFVPFPFGALLFIPGVILTIGTVPFILFKPEIPIWAWLIGAILLIFILRRDKRR